MVLLERAGRAAPRGGAPTRGIAQGLGAAEGGPARLGLRAEAARVAPLGLERAEEALARGPDRGPDRGVVVGVVVDPDLGVVVGVAHGSPSTVGRRPSCTARRTRGPNAGLERGARTPGPERRGPNAGEVRREPGPVWWTTSPGLRRPTAIPERVERRPGAVAEAHPEMTAVAVLARLKGRHSERFADAHLRTPRRMVKAWRAEQAKRMTPLGAAALTPPQPATPGHILG